MGRSRKVGASMIQSCRERRGSLAIKSTQLKGKSKGLLGRASGGSRNGAAEWFMGGSDFSQKIW